MENENVCCQELPKYECHKIVHALKIKSIEFDSDKSVEENRETDGSAIITPVEDSYATFKVNHDVVMRIKNIDDDLGYYVVYEDGYKSWSPTKVFEDGYTRI